MKLKQLPFPSCPNGGCVPYLIANITNSSKPIDGLEITDQTSFDEHDASLMLQKAMDGKAYFKPILAYDRFIHPQKGPMALTWIEYRKFAQTATITQLSVTADGENSVIILLEVITRSGFLHAVGLFYDPKSQSCIIIDPAKEKPLYRGISDVFDLYKVLKVSPLFFDATRLVLYPLDELDFLFEKEAEIVN